ncbi:sugar ABC transporter substrate-binding protein [Aquibacillus kalidii]|uniref:sugar ABC transporter substrate-binding protein n=1 Tax=Aquibacillus kalidii TaxID=2762597 RepID=UPI002E2A29D9|nr:substrate-binding domain-containing protein [Aquibacillus kalidii]
MRKIVITLLTLICGFLFYLTVMSATKVFTTDWQLPETKVTAQSNFRLVLISQDLDTPFWNQVGAEAQKQAKSDNVSLEVWGSYGNNHDDFLKKMEVAIYSQVDGIIVQGLDTDRFKELAKTKAAAYGIPIITVANDVSVEESLRRTYVGSDQYLAGNMIAKQLVKDMGVTGDVILIHNSEQQFYQEQRLMGIKDILKNYPDINIVDGETNHTREQVIAVTKGLLNKEPNVDAFIAVDANIAETMIQEIERRSQVIPYYIYSFGDDTESNTLLKQGKLDGIIEQSPGEIGKLSVKLMVDWLNNETNPLHLEGYFTDIRVLKAKDIR